MMKTYTYFLYKKLRIWASTDSFLKLSDFEYSEFLTSFLKVPSESRKSHGSTAVSRRKVVLFNVIFEEDLAIFVRNEGKCCVILEIS